MSASAVTPGPASVKGWCPGALRPMQTGDGLVVRVRPRCGALSLAQVEAVCRIASGHGNGLIDLTRRANLQIRGIDARDLPLVWDGLSDVGLMDAHADAEAVRNVMTGPLAGIDPTETADIRPIAAALEAELATIPALWSLPGKFGFAVDGGGCLSLDGERADIRLKAVRAGGGTRIAVGIDRAEGASWLRLVQPAQAYVAAVRVALAFVAAPKPHPRARLTDLDLAALAELAAALDGYGEPVGPAASSAPQVATRVGAIEAQGAVFAVGLGVPLGRMAAQSLARVAETAAGLGVSEIRLSPWRVLYLPASGTRPAATLLDAAQACGLAIMPDDPMMAIDACPGAPACRSAHADTHAAARRVAGMLPLAGVRSVHISGCPKGCARSRASDLVLIARAGGFGIVRNGTADTPPEAFVDAQRLRDLPTLLLART